MTVREIVQQATEAPVGTAVCTALEAASPGLLDVRPAGCLPALIRQIIPRAIRVFWEPMQDGNADWFGHWFWWRSPLTSFLCEVCALELPGDLALRHRAFEDATLNAGWWFPHQDFVLVSERPREIHLEAGAWERGEDSHLHRVDGPALAWPDDWGVHAVHGQQIPAWVIERRQDINIEAIEKETDSGVRRVMLELYGPARYLAERRAAVIDEGPPGHAIAALRGARLLRVDLPHEPEEEREPIVYLERLDSSAAPGGTQRRCLEPINAKAYDGEAGRSCQAALASRVRHRDAHGDVQLTFARWQDYTPQDAPPSRPPYRPMDA